MCSLVGTFVNEKTIADDLGSCHSCDPVKERLEHNGRCPCCEVIYHFSIFSFIFRLFQQCKQCLGKQFDQCCECFGKCASLLYHVFGNVKYFLILTVGKNRKSLESFFFGLQRYLRLRLRSGLSALTFRA